jgi:hypothetical protein
VTDKDLCVCLQYFVVLAALALLSLTASAQLPKTEDQKFPRPQDVVNSYITQREHFTWKSVDSGDAETHYKTFELLVRLALSMASFPLAIDLPQAST